MLILFCFIVSLSNSVTMGSLKRVDKAKAGIIQISQDNLKIILKDITTILK